MLWSADQSLISSDVTISLCPFIAIFNPSIRYPWTHSLLSTSTDYSHTYTRVQMTEITIALQGKMWAMQDVLRMEISLQVCSPYLLLVEALTSLVKVLQCCIAHKVEIRICLITGMCDFVVSMTVHLTLSFLPTCYAMFFALCFCVVSTVLTCTYLPDCLYGLLIIKPLKSSCRSQVTV